MQFSVETEQEDDGRWIAEVVELPGVIAYGQSRDEALAHAQALALRVIAERLWLASALTGEAAGEVAPPPLRSAMTADEARAIWAQLRESISQLPGPRRTLGEQLDADRRDRMRSLFGSHAEADDVDA